MRPLDDAAALALWERGAALHPLDRALLLAAWARDDLAPDALADLPLGALNAALIELRRSSFGARIEARIGCPRCGEQLEIALQADDLIDAAAASDANGEAAVGDWRFRAPSMRDLAVVAGERDPQAAALRLLERCCVGDAGAQTPDLASLGTPLERGAIPPLAEVEAALEALDPGADIALAVSCDACPHSWEASLDVGALLWDEVAARAVMLLGDVHRLASAYGWTEGQVLALSPQRRAAYIGMSAA